MTTEADIGHGIQVFLARPAAPTNWIKLAEVTDGAPPPINRDAVEATNHDSEDAFREYIGGLRGMGEMSIETNLVPGSAQEQLLLESMADRKPWPMKYVFPNGAEVSFSQLCTAYEPSSPMEDKMTASSTHQPSGKPTWTEA